MAELKMPVLKQLLLDNYDKDVCRESRARDEGKAQIIQLIVYPLRCLLQKPQASGFFGLRGTVLIEFMVAAESQNDDSVLPYNHLRYFIVDNWRNRVE